MKKQLSEPTGCITSDPAQTATSPASAPLWTKPGSFLPATSAARIPPAIASKEFSFETLHRRIQGVLGGYSDEIRASRKRLKKSKMPYSV